MGLFKKGKLLITAKFHKTALVICSRSRKGKIPSYSKINTVAILPSELLILKHASLGSGISLFGNINVQHTVKENKYLNT